MINSYQDIVNEIDGSFDSINCRLSDICQLDGNVSVPTQSQDHDTASQSTAEVIRLDGDFLPGEKRPLGDRLKPRIPEPCWVEVADADGWNLIDQIGAWQAFLCEFKVLEDIPYQHRSAWTWAFSHVLDRILNAATVDEVNRALVWFLFLPQALLRQPRRGG